MYGIIRYERTVDRTEVRWASVDGYRCVPDINDGSECALLTIVLLTVGSRVVRMRRS